MGEQRRPECYEQGNCANEQVRRRRPHAPRDLGDGECQGAGEDQATTANDERPAAGSNVARKRAAQPMPTVAILIFIKVSIAGAIRSGWDTQSPAVGKVITEPAVPMPTSRNEMRNSAESIRRGRWIRCNAAIASPTAITMSTKRCSSGNAVVATPSVATATASNASAVPGGSEVISRCAHRHQIATGTPLI